MKKREIDMFFPGRISISTPLLSSFLIYHIPPPDLIQREKKKEEKDSCSSSWHPIQIPLDLHEKICAAFVFFEIQKKRFRSKPRSEACKVLTLRWPQCFDQIISIWILAKVGCLCGYDRNLGHPSDSIRVRRKDSS